MFADLPSDLEEMDESLGPPPSWFTQFYSQGIRPNAFYFPQQFAGLGDRPQEIEVNPVERLQDLKYKNQERNKRIPIEANRYTKIYPLSPLFRENKAKYGFGGFNLLNKNNLLYLALLSGAIYLCCFHKK